MARLRTQIIALATACAVAVSLTSCGGSSTEGLLPGNKASEISANITRVQNLAAEGNCSEAADQAEVIRQQIYDLGHVNKQLKRTLIDGVQLLHQLAVRCVSTASSTGVTSTPSTDTTDTGDTATDTTEQTPPEPKKKPKPKKTKPPAEPAKPTKTTPPATTPPVTPPGKGKGTGNNGNGNGNGGGNSGDTGSGGIAP